MGADCAGSEEAVEAVHHKRAIIGRKCRRPLRDGLSERIAVVVVGLKLAGYI